MPDSEIVSFDELFPGDIILTRGRGVIDFANRLGQALARGQSRLSPFSHAAICTGPGIVMDADIRKSLGTRKLAAWLVDVSCEHSVVFRRPAASTPAPSAAMATREQLAEIFKKQEQDVLRSLELVSIAQVYVGRRYNFAFLKRNSAKRRKFFCSEFVSTALSELDKMSFHTVPEKTLPIDLLKLLREAGWQELRLNNFIAPASPPPIPIDWKEFRENLPKEMLDDAPHIGNLIDQLEGSPERDWHQLREVQSRLADLAIQSENDRLSMAKAIDTYSSLVLEYFVIGAQMVIQSKSEEELRSSLKEIDYPVDLLDSLKALERLRHLLSERPTHLPKSHEIVIQAFVTYGKKDSLIVAIERVRFALILEDLTAFRAINECMGKHLNREAAIKQLHALRDSRPYLAVLDKDLRTKFDTEFAATTSALREATYERQALFGDLFEVIGGVQAVLHELPL